MGVFEDVLEGYRRIRLLILDEWLLFPLNTTEARDLLEIVERRLGVSSTIFSSQFTPVDGTRRSVKESSPMPSWTG